MKSVEERHSTPRLATPAALVSLVLHLIIVLVLALVLFREVEQTPLELRASREQDDLAEFSLLEVQSQAIVADVPDSAPQFVSVMAELPSIQLPPVEGDGLSGLFEGSQSGGSPELSAMLQDAVQNGIEIVIVFDSTQSMRPEIEAVKKRIGLIGKAVFDKIPLARISLITYRDEKDAYVVRGLRLCEDMRQIDSFMKSVQAGGGRDRPEAVQAGMQWAVDNNYYRPNCQRVMLIFGDAPPHRRHFGTCINLAIQFATGKKAGLYSAVESLSSKNVGRVTTITCRRYKPLGEFYDIAHAGGGDAYTLHDTRKLMDDLLVLAFGEQHREGVLRFFELK